MTTNFALPAGVWPVLLTPFKADGAIDLPALDAMVEFYLAAGVPGIFANCLSSEVFQLTEDEAHQLAVHLLKRIHGRCALVSGGNLGATPAAQQACMRRIAETGVAGTIILLSTLQQAGLAGQCFQLAEGLAGYTGCYEVPVPNHWLLTPAEVRELTRDERFVFFKETSRQVETFTAKLRAADGSRALVLQANLRALPGSLANGAPGTCATFANVCPEFTIQYLQQFAAGDCAAAEATFRQITVLHDLMIANNYPASAKYILQRRGLPLEPHTRGGAAKQLGAEHRAALDELLAEYDFVRPAISAQRAEHFKVEIKLPSGKS